MRWYRIISYFTALVSLSLWSAIEFTSAGFVPPLIAFAKELSGRIQWQRSISFDIHGHTCAHVSSRSTSNTGFTGEGRCLFRIALIRVIF